MEVIYMNGGVFINFSLVKKLSYEKMWSLAKLATESDLSLSTLFALQRSNRKASLRTVSKLANALNVAPNEIIEK